MVFVSFLANAVVVVSITWLSGFFIAPEQRFLTVMFDSDFGVLFVSRILPFLIVMPIIAYRFAPCFAGDFREKVEASVSLQKRVLQLPITTAVIATAGWVIGIFAFGLIISFFRSGTPRSFVIDSLIFSWVLAAMALIVMYYLLEFMNRRLILPHVSAGFQIEALKGTFNLSMRMRLALHLVATVGLPLAILSRIIFFLNQLKPAESAYLPAKDFILLLAVIIITGLILTWLQSKFISAPLKAMQAATEQVQRGDYDAHVSVTSGDEIGALAVDINAMAKGLKEREAMRDMFGKLVDPSVRDYLLHNRSAITGETREVTILFCDLAGFTSYSEQESPEAVVAFLNGYFSVAQKVVTTNGGIINKFIGDAFMALFNAPVPLESHAASAVQAARDFRSHFERLRSGYGQGAPRFRIGIHTGEVIAGRIGSEDRQEYTVIGDAVNTASRIEALGKKVGENMLVSDATVAQLTEAGLRRVGSVRLRGKSTPTGIYAI